MLKKLTRALGCLVYTTALGAVCALVAYAAFSAYVRGGVTPVPDLRGLEESEATALLADQGLRVGWDDDSRYDERVPRGHVLRQDPGAGAYVKRDTEVTLTLSRGPRRIEVPDLRGQAVQAAQVSLSAAGLGIGRVFDVYGEGPIGAVVTQEPASGESVAVDARVDLFVNAGAGTEVYVMPDLVGRPYEPVRRFFERRGIRIGRVGYVALDGIAPGTVLRQFPLAGHPLQGDDVLSLDVAADPQPVDSQPVDSQPAVSAPASTRSDDGSTPGESPTEPSR